MNTVAQELWKYYLLLLRIWPSLTGDSIVSDESIAFVLYMLKQRDINLSQHQPVTDHIGKRYECTHAALAMCTQVNIDKMKLLFCSENLVYSYMYVMLVSTYIHLYIHRYIANLAQLNKIYLNIIYIPLHLMCVRECVCVCVRVCTSLQCLFVYLQVCTCVHVCVSVYAACALWVGGHSGNCDGLNRYISLNQRNI